VTHYDSETALTRQGDDLWVGHVHERWNIAGNPNGGYLLAIALQALRTLGPHPDPVTVTTHYLRPGTSDLDCEVRTQLVRSGRSMTTGRATLSQAGKDRIEVLAGFGDLAVVADMDASIEIPPPQMLPPDECGQRSGQQQGVDLPILDRLDTRIHPDYAVPGEVGRAEMRGWIRFKDGREPDSLAVPLLCDAFPPSLFGLLGSVGWVPTVELTVHVRRRPAPGWVRGRLITNDLHNGRMIEDGTFWDQNGDLIAQSRQVGLLLAR
jgi:acyl-CoA thioesterase